MYSAFDKFSEGYSEYELARGGFVRIKKDDLQSVAPKYESTIITLKNGQCYLLKGRDYGC